MVFTPTRNSIDVCVSSSEILKYMYTHIATHAHVYILTYSLTHTHTYTETLDATE